MECKYVKPLQNKDLIIEFQKEYSFIFPRGFICFIRTNNGGRPPFKTFDTERDKEKSMKTFLSFNRSDLENIWDMVKLVSNQSLIPFAIDNFGNLICFDSKTNAIVFWNSENCLIEFIAKTFNDFINNLY